jgi:hypothetical protein
VAEPDDHEQRRGTAAAPMYARLTSREKKSAVTIAGW